MIRNYAIFSAALLLFIARPAIAEQDVVKGAAAASVAGGAIAVGATVVTAKARTRLTSIENSMHLTQKQGLAPYHRESSLLVGAPGVAEKLAQLRTWEMRREALTAALDEMKVKIPNPNKSQLKIIQSTEATLLKLEGNIQSLSKDPQILPIGRAAERASQAVKIMEGTAAPSQILSGLEAKKLLGVQEQLNQLYSQGSATHRVYEMAKTARSGAVVLTGVMLAVGAKGVYDGFQKTNNLAETEGPALAARQASTGAAR